MMRATTTINLRILWLSLTIPLSSDVEGIIVLAPTQETDASNTSGGNCSAVLMDLAPLSLAPTSINYTGRFPRRWVKRASEVTSTSTSPESEVAVIERTSLSYTSDIQSGSISTTPSDFRQSLSEFEKGSRYVHPTKASKPVAFPFKRVEVKWLSEVITAPTISGNTQSQLSTVSNLTSISGFQNGLQNTTQSNIGPSLITFHKEPKVVLPTATTKLPPPTLTQMTPQINSTTERTKFTTSPWYSMLASISTSDIATTSFKSILNETNILSTLSSTAENSIYVESQIPKEIRSLKEPIHRKQYNPNAQKDTRSKIDNNSKVEAPLLTKLGISTKPDNPVTPSFTKQSPSTTPPSPRISSHKKVTPSLPKGLTIANTNKLANIKSSPPKDPLSLEKELHLFLASRLPLALDEDLLYLWGAPYLQRLKYVNYEMVDDILQAETGTPPKSSDCPLEYQELMFLSLKRILGLLIISLPQSLKEVEEATWDTELDAYFFRPQEKNILDVKVCRECYTKDHKGKCRQIIFCKGGARLGPNPRLTPTILQRLASRRG